MERNMAQTNELDTESSAAFADAWAAVATLHSLSGALRQLALREDGKQLEMQVVDSGRSDRGAVEQELAQERAMRQQLQQQLQQAQQQLSRSYGQVVDELASTAQQLHLRDRQVASLEQQVACLQGTTGTSRASTGPPSNPGFVTSPLDTDPTPAMPPATGDTPGGTHVPGMALDTVSRGSAASSPDAQPAGLHPSMGLLVIQGAGPQPPRPSPSPQAKSISPSQWSRSPSVPDDPSPTGRPRARHTWTCTLPNPLDSSQLLPDHTLLPRPPPDASTCSAPAPALSLPPSQHPNPPQAAQPLPQQAGSAAAALPRPQHQPASAQSTAEQPSCLSPDARMAIRGRGGPGESPPANWPPSGSSSASTQGPALSPEHHLDWRADRGTTVRGHTVARLFTEDDASERDSPQAAASTTASRPGVGFQTAAIGVHGVSSRQADADLRQRPGSWGHFGMPPQQRTRLQGLRREPAAPLPPSAHESALGASRFFPAAPLSATSAQMSAGMHAGWNGSLEPGSGSSVFDWAMLGRSRDQQAQHGDDDGSEDYDSNSSSSGRRSEWETVVDQSRGTGSGGMGAFHRAPESEEEEDEDDEGVVDSRQAHSQAYPRHQHVPPAVAARLRPGRGSGDGMHQAPAPMAAMTQPAAAARPMGDHTQHMPQSSTPSVAGPVVNPLWQADVHLPLDRGSAAAPVMHGGPRQPQPDQAVYQTRPAAAQVAALSQQRTVDSYVQGRGGAIACAPVAGACARVPGGRHAPSVMHTDSQPYVRPRPPPEQDTFPHTADQGSEKLPPAAATKLPPVQQQGPAAAAAAAATERLARTTRARPGPLHAPHQHQAAAPLTFKHPTFSDAPPAKLPPLSHTGVSPSFQGPAAAAAAASPSTGSAHGAARSASAGGLAATGLDVHSILNPGNGGWPPATRLPAMGMSSAALSGPSPYAAGGLHHASASSLSAGGALDPAGGLSRPSSLPSEELFNAIKKQLASLQATFVQASLQGAGHNSNL